MFQTSFCSVVLVPGSWVKDVREGHGVYTYTNGDTYEGEWLNHVRYVLGPSVRYSLLSSQRRFRGLKPVAEWADMDREFTTTGPPAHATEEAGSTAEWRTVESTFTPTTDTRATSATTRYLLVDCGFLLMQLCVASRSVMFQQWKGSNEAATTQTHKQCIKK